MKTYTLEENRLHADLMVHMANIYADKATAADRKGDPEEAEKARASAQRLRTKAVAAKILAAL